MCDARVPLLGSQLIPLHRVGKARGDALAHGVHASEAVLRSHIPLLGAELQARAKEPEIRTGLNPFSVGPPFEQFARNYLTWHKREYPGYHYRIAQICEQHAIPVFEWTPVEGIRPEEVERYKAARNAKAATITKAVRTLKTIFNKAAEWGYADGNPIRSVSGPKILDSRPPPWFDVAEMKKATTRRDVLQFGN